MVSHQLVEQWRARLSAWQQRLNEGRPRPWIARAYIRVLSYLLAQYAPPADTGPTLENIEADAPTESEHRHERSMMKFEAAVPDLSGKPPRTRQEIRSVLEAVQANVPQVEQGPLVDGLQSDDPIVVAAFYRRRLASGLSQRLAAAGIESALLRFRQQTQVLVRAGDLERAKPIVAGHAAVAHDSPPWRETYYSAFLFSLFTVAGATLGAFVGLSLAIAKTYTGEVIPLGFALGALLGSLAWAISLIIRTTAGD